MYKRLKIRLYPNKQQEQVLQQHVDGYRFAYNLCLEYKKHLWDYHKIPISGYGMRDELCVIMKELGFLSNCKVECIRDAATDVDKSFQKFFKQKKGFPKFKSKKDKQSFTANRAIFIKNEKLFFFKNTIKFKTSGGYRNKLKNSKIKQCTFIKDKTDKWFASCLIEDNEIKTLPKTENSVGVDMGLKHFLIISNGEYVPNNKFSIRNEYKLRRLQRKFAKTKKGGKNREKLRIRIAKLYQKITNQREHFYHQVSNKLIRENQSITIETLKVANMVKNRKLSRAISDVAWSSFTSMLEYKCNWYGRELIKVPSNYASSKICSCCGNKKEDLKLSDRIYNCDSCGISLDRDENAATNLKQYKEKHPLI